MGAVGAPPDEPGSGAAAGDESAETEAERVIRHRLDGHRAALELAEQLDLPETLRAQVEETAHRLAEDQDILDEIDSEESDDR